MAGGFAHFARILAVLPASVGCLLTADPERDPNAWCRLWAGAGGTLTPYLGVPERITTGAEGALELEWGVHPTIGVVARIFEYQRRSEWRTSATGLTEAETVTGDGAGAEVRWYPIGPRERDSDRRRPLAGVTLALGLGGAATRWRERRDRNGDGTLGPGELRRGHGQSGLASAFAGYTWRIAHTAGIALGLSAGAVSGHDPHGGWIGPSLRFACGF